MTKVPGEVSFTLNLGATVKQTMVEAKALVREAIAQIEVATAGEVRAGRGCRFGSRPRSTRR